VAEAFYRPLDSDAGRFAATRHTAGPWTPDAQHLGPPSALLVRALEGIPADRTTMLARVTVEILGPVPLSELTVTARMSRPGRSVEFLEAELSADGRIAARASAWRIATSDSSAVSAGQAPRLPSVADAPTFGRPEGWGHGYLDAMEWRSIKGGLDTAGPACAWVRQRVPLVDGEHPSPLQRLFTVADSGNGLSNRLDPRAWWFINTELTVHVQREPVGEWIGLDAHTVIGDNGVGTATSTLHDERGHVAFGAQALMIRPR
jgi:hypothetical protein